ncbi:hypothetical protein P154DRAFT_563936 [Amniculicola lignicola CBS 123094]|uniref:Uncharacterized protein n=1 Tax=Amniculicola lignicola CBS 123094 TaxID=1392246 RepID=A0A6A5WFF1_9PLEO|nr:hypothetical protein P154DRAFT_563936 [Amniculicola lignicola CBS 123094]
MSADLGSRTEAELESVPSSNTRSELIANPVNTDSDVAPSSMLPSSSKSSLAAEATPCEASEVTPTSSTTTSSNQPSTDLDSKEDGLRIPKSVSDYTPEHWKSLCSYQYEVGRGFLNSYTDRPRVRKTAGPTAKNIFSKEDYTTYVQWHQKTSRPGARLVGPKPIPFPRPLEYHEFFLLKSGTYAEKQRCEHKRHPADTKTLGMRYCPCCLITIGVQFVLSIEEACKNCPWIRSALLNDLRMAWHYARCELANATDGADMLAETLEKDYEGEVAPECYSWTKAAEIGWTGLQLSTSQPKDALPEALNIEPTKPEISNSKQQPVHTEARIGGSNDQMMNSSEDMVQAVQASIPQKALSCHLDDALQQKPTHVVEGDDQIVSKTGDPLDKIMEDLSIRTSTILRKRKCVSFSSEPLDTDTSRNMSYFGRLYPRYRPGKHSAPPGQEWEDTSHYWTPDYFLRHCKLFVSEYTLHPLLPLDTKDPRYVGLLGQWQHAGAVFEDWHRIKTHIAPTRFTQGDSILVVLKKKEVEKEKEDIGGNTDGKTETGEGGRAIMSNEKKVEAPAIDHIALWSMEEDVHGAWEIDRKKGDRYSRKWTRL